VPIFDGGIFDSGKFDTGGGATSFTVSAVIASTTSGSLSVSAWLQAAGVSSFTANAISRATRSSSFLVDSAIASISTKTGSTTADAIRRATRTGSFTSSAEIVYLRTGSFALNAAKAIRDRSFSLAYQWRSVANAGIPNRGVASKIRIGGVDVTNHVEWATASFTAKVNGAIGDCSLDILDRDRSLLFTFGQEIVLWIDGVIRWGGWVQRPTRTFAMPVQPHPLTSPVLWHIEGVDYNAIFDKRVVHDLAHPERVWNYPAGTADNDVINNVWNYLDMDGFTKDIARVGPAVLDIPGVTARDGGEVVAPGYTFRNVLTSIIRNTDAVFYCSPTKVITYVDSAEVNNPYTLTDQPNSVHDAGYREAKFIDDSTDMVNDAMFWGVGYGSQVPVFARHQDTTSQTDHGLWQAGQFTSGVYRQATAVAIAASYVDGSPAAHRGAKNPKRSIELVTWSTVFGVGDVVNIYNSSYGCTDVLPIRMMSVTWPTPVQPRFALQMSWEIDAAWSMYDPWIPSAIGGGGGYGGYGGGDNTNPPPSGGDLTYLSSQGYGDRTTAESWWASRSIDAGGITDTTFSAGLIPDASINGHGPETVGFMSPAHEGIAEILVTNMAPVGATMARLRSLVTSQAALLGAPAMVETQDIQIGWRFDQSDWASTTPVYGQSAVSTPATGNLMPGGSAALDITMPVIDGRIQFIWRIDTIRDPRNGVHYTGAINDPQHVAQYPATGTDEFYEEHVYLTGIGDGHTYYTLDFYSGEPLGAGGIGIIGQKVCDVLVPQSSPLSIYPSGTEWKTTQASYIPGSTKLAIDGVFQFGAYTESDPDNGLITINLGVAAGSVATLCYLTNGLLP